MCTRTGATSRMTSLMTFRTCCWSSCVSYWKTGYVRSSYRKTDEAEGKKQLQKIALGIGMSQTEWYLLPRNTSYLISQTLFCCHKQECYSFTSEKIMAIINRYYSMGRRDDAKKTNKFGFVCPTPSPSRAASPAASCTSSPTSSPGSTCSSVSFFEEKDERRIFLEQVASEVLSTRATKFWMNSMVTEQNIKMMIREYGIPNDMRPHLWAKFIQTKLLGQHHDLNHLLQLSRETIKTTDINEDATLRQIELDLYRTMPNHEMFESSIGVSDVVQQSIKILKLLLDRKAEAYPNRVLRPRESCQWLLSGNEFHRCSPTNRLSRQRVTRTQRPDLHHWSLLSQPILWPPPNRWVHSSCFIECRATSLNCFSGVRADQLLLRDLLLDRMGMNGKRLQTNHQLHQQNVQQTIHEITNSLTINWFLSLFHNALPFQVSIFTILFDQLLVYLQVDHDLSLSDISLFEANNRQKEWRMIVQIVW